MYEVVEPSESTMYENDNDFDTQEYKDDYYMGLGIFEGDPDILYINDGSASAESLEKKLIYFLIDDDAKEILVSEMPETAEQEQFLQAQALGNIDHAPDQSWDGVTKYPLVIAYRGGTGYSYSINIPKVMA